MKMVFGLWNVRVSKLLTLSGRDCIWALGTAGFYQKRRESRHVTLRRDDPFSQVTVPDHTVLAKGTLGSILRGADLTVDEFIELL
jgi:predicted RNA binding protein YcfA (HicA-like mRNA interferase family)